MKKVLWILQGVFFCAAFFFVELHEQGGAMWMGWVALGCMTLAAVLQLVQNRAEHKKIARICRNRIQGKEITTNHSISQKGGFVKRENNISL